MAEVQHGKGSLMHVSRRSFLAGTAAAAAFSIIGLPRKSAAAETPLQVLTGPVTSMGGSAYDTLQVAQAGTVCTGRIARLSAISGRPDQLELLRSGPVALSALVLGLRGIRSGATGRARSATRRGRNDPYPDGDGLGRCAARVSNAGPGDLLPATRATRIAKTVVNSQAAKAVRYFPKFNGTSGDCAKRATP